MGNMKIKITIELDDKEKTPDDLTDALRRVEEEARIEREKYRQSYELINKYSKGI